MHQLTHSDLIWNRACGEHALRELPGDRALADLLRAHGLAMNGGVLHAVECLTEDELSAAEAGYRYFDYDEIASLLRGAKVSTLTESDIGGLEHRFDSEYLKLIPCDDSIEARFQSDLMANPSAYAPLRTIDIAP